MHSIIHFALFKKCVGTIIISILLLGKRMFFNGVEVKGRYYYNMHFIKYEDACKSRKVVTNLTL